MLTITIIDDDGELCFDDGRLNVTTPSRAADILTAAVEAAVVDGDLIWRRPPGERGRANLSTDSNAADVIHHVADELAIGLVIAFDWQESPLDAVN